MENSRKRLLILEYKLLKEIDNKNIKILKENEKLTLISEKKLANVAFDSLKKLENKNLVNEDGITNKGKNYLKNFPLPKEKLDKPKKFKKSDYLLLEKLDKAIAEWMPSIKITSKRDDLINLVRLGYAVGMKNRDGIKLNKDEIVENKSLFRSNDKNKYYFKITKKGKDKLKNKNKNNLFI